MRGNLNFQKLVSISIPNLAYRWTVVFLSLALGNAWSQKLPEKGLRIAFYNVENLFDPEDDPDKNDEEFTPKGTRYWSDYRYREKSNRMAKAILSIGDWDAPDAVGLAEVENRKVVDDLVNSEVLRKFNYKVIHSESPDRRGIDVAMIYRVDRMKLLSSSAISVTMPDDPGFATRDILYAKMLLSSKDTFHLLYCHWPSRYGGQAQSEPKRIRAAQTVRKIVDSLFAINPSAQVAIAGDFNDEFGNISLKDHLVRPEGKTPLINLMAQLPASEGSHRYRGVWSYLDQIIVSAALLDSMGLDIADQSAVVVRHPFLLEVDEKYPGLKPFRTFIGMRHHGGFSDHLPVYIDLIISNSK